MSLPTDLSGNVEVWLILMMLIREQVPGVQQSRVETVMHELITDMKIFWLERNRKPEAIFLSEGGLKMLQQELMPLADSNRLYSDPCWLSDYRGMGIIRLDGLPNDMCIMVTKDVRQRWLEPHWSKV